MCEWVKAGGTGERGGVPYCSISIWAIRQPASSRPSYDSPLEFRFGFNGPGAGPPLEPGHAGHLSGGMCCFHCQPGTVPLWQWQVRLPAGVAGRLLMAE